MSVLEMVLYPLLATIMVVWAIVLIVKFKKTKKKKQQGIDEDEED